MTSLPKHTSANSFIVWTIALSIVRGWSFPSKISYFSGTYYPHTWNRGTYVTRNWEEPANNSSINWMWFRFASLQLYADISIGQSTSLSDPNCTGIVRCCLPHCISVSFTCWYWRKTVAQPEFRAWILFADELDFTQVTWICKTYASCTGGLITSQGVRVNMRANCASL